MHPHNYTHNFRKTTNRKQSPVIVELRTILDGGDIVDKKVKKKLKKLCSSKKFLKKIHFFTWKSLNNCQNQTYQLNCIPKAGQFLLWNKFFRNTFFVLSCFAIVFLIEPQSAKLLLFYKKKKFQKFTTIQILVEKIIFFFRNNC